MDRKRLQDFLVSRLAQKYLDWSYPKFVPSPGPEVREPFERYKKHCKNRITQTEQAVPKLSDSELLEAITYFNSGPHLASHQTPEAIARYRFITDDEFIKKPVWWAGGFGVDGYQADFRYFAQLEAWTFNEAVCVSIGIDPSKFIPVKSQSGVDKEVHLFWERREELVRQKFFSDVSKNRSNVRLVSPSAFCRWAAEKLIDIPDELYEAVSEITAEQYRRHGTDKGHKSKSPEYEKREITSLLTLVIGLAKAGYGYDENEKRSKIAKEIRDDLANIGLDLHEDTIRKHLRKAAELLPKGL